MHAVTADVASLPPDAARTLAVEILLADPESLGDDVLEACLYILRDRLRAKRCGTATGPTASPFP